MSHFTPLDMPQRAEPPAQNPGTNPALSPADNAAAASAGKGPALYGLADRLARLMTDLTQLISQETALLAAHRPREAQALHGTKERMIRDYKDVISRLKINQQSLGQPGSTVRQTLRKLGEALTAALKDHARVVIRLKSVSQGLIKSVGEDVARRRNPVRHYGRSAHMTPTPSHSPTSLALNQVI